MELINKKIIFFIIIALLVVFALLFLRCFIASDGQNSNVIGAIERVKLITPKGEVEIEAKIDTGADSTSIDINLVKSLDLEINKNKKKVVITSEGREERSTVDLDFILGNKKIHSLATVEGRSGLSTQMIIGKNDLEGFMIDPSRQFISPSG